MGYRWPSRRAYRRVAVAIWFLCSLWVWAPGEAQPAEGAEAAESAEEHLLPTVRCADFFIAEAEINGRGPFRLILDSGASVTVLTKQAARRAGVRKKIKKLQIGPLTGRRVRIIRAELGHISKALRYDIDGILGHPVFATLAVIYDYPAGEVRVSKERLSPDDPTTLPTGNRSRPFLNVKVGEVEAEVLIDTGSGHGLKLEDPERFVWQEEPRRIGHSYRFKGREDLFAGRLGADFVAGPLELEEPVTMVSSSVSLLGQPVMKHFVVTLDGVGRLAQFRRPDGSTGPVELPPYRSSGLLYRLDDEALVVEEVLAGSVGERLGVLPGDRIVRIDDKPIPELGCDDRGWQRRSQVEIEVRRGEETRRLELVGETLFP